MRRCSFVRATSTLARLGQRRYRHKTGDLPGATPKGAARGCDHLSRKGVEMRKITTLALLALTLGLVVTASASASATQYHATFVEVGGAIPGGSCGSATISGAGHVAYQCVYLNACGDNCHVRTITFDDGST